MADDEYSRDLNENNLKYRNGGVVDQDAATREEFDFGPFEEEDAHEIDNPEEELYQSSEQKETNNNALDTEELNTASIEGDVRVHSAPEYNNTSPQSSTREMIDETIQDRPYLPLYAASIVLMMVSFNLASPMLALLGAGLMLMTTFHYVE